MKIHQKLSLIFLILMHSQNGISQFTIAFIGNPIESCVGSTVDFDMISSPTASTSWQWDFGDGSTSSLENPTHSYNNAGVYTVTLIASDGIDTDTLTKPNYLIINEFYAGYTHTMNGLTATFMDTSISDNSAIISWEWNFDDGTTSPLQNPSHTYSYSANECYDVTLSIENDLGCRYSLTIMNLICMTQVEGINIENIRLYPNPTTNDIIIEGIKGNYNLNIYNDIGEKLYTEVNVTDNEKRVDLSEFPVGILIFNLTSDEISYYYKVIKK